MRARSMLMLPAMVSLLLLTGPFSSAAPKSSTDRALSAAVTVHLDRRAYPGNTPVKVSVQNNLPDRISLQGCASYHLQRFVEDRYVPLPPRRCEWEMEALSVPKGARTFEFSPPDTERGIFRVVVTYGLGCRDGVPLSRAQCTRIETAYSPSFILLQAAEP